MARADNNSRLPPTVAGYTLGQRLGTGGMGTVYLAHPSDAQPSLTGAVALKLLHPHLDIDEDSRLEFIEEARLSIQIDHPNVVRVFELGEDPAGVFFVMEYVEGVTLNEVESALIERGEKPDPSWMLRLIDDFLCGLHAAHELRGEDGELLQLVHRDVSPPNILIGRDGVARIADFGIAKALSRKSFTQEGIIKGKFGYISPEQVYAESLDRRADVWAAAAVAWEALAGRRLIIGEGLEALRASVEFDAPRLHSVRPDLPEALSKVLAKGLAREVGQRYGTVEELRTELAEAWVKCGGRWASRETLRARVNALVPPANVEALFSSPTHQGPKLVKPGNTAETRSLASLPRDEAGAQMPAPPMNPGATDILPRARTKTPAPMAATRPGALETLRLKTPKRSLRAVMAAVAVLGISGALGGMALRQNDGEAEAGSLTVRAAGILHTPNSQTPKSVGGPVGTTSTVSDGSTVLGAVPVPLVPPETLSSGLNGDGRRKVAAPAPLLQVWANRELAQLRIGSRLITAAVPSKQISVELRPKELGKRIRVEGIDKDGRVSGVWLNPGARSVQLTLSGKPAKPAVMRKRSPGREAPEEPGLADNPYEVAG